jgi:hypothetical protein
MLRPLRVPLYREKLLKQVNDSQELYFVATINDTHIYSPVQDIDFSLLLTVLL